MRTRKRKPKGKRSACGLLAFALGCFMAGLGGSEARGGRETRRDDSALEPGLKPGNRAMAFNLTVLSSLLGTSIEPDFSGAELLIEDVAEHEYRIDRAMFHVTGSKSIRRAKGIRMGRMTEIPENDPEFGSDAESIVQAWCERSGIPFLGRADIGHDAANRLVPFNLPSN